MKLCDGLRLAGRHCGRAPQGARGLKSIIVLVHAARAAVAPRKGRVG